MNWNDYRRACYMLARDEREYIADGTFNQRAEVLIQEGLKLGVDAISYMESVISLGDEFERADLEFAPILVYMTEDICCNVLNIFAAGFAEALRRKGETVQIIDTRQTPLDDLTKLRGKRFKALIGIQSYVFSIKLMNGDNLHDSIKGPKFNMFLDHPTCLYKHLVDAPKDLYVLTHDRNYVKYVKKYYPNIKNSFILPPAGEIYNPHDDTENIENSGSNTDRSSDNITKIYDISFVAAYHNPMDMLAKVKELDLQYDGAASVLSQYMIDNPNVTYEDALNAVVGDISASDHYNLSASYFYAMTYYRESIVKTILGAGLTLHVFGDSWDCPLWNSYPNLHIHPIVEGNDALRVYAQSKISLNTMSWHKDGMTERIANIMLNHAVALTDPSGYLTEHFEDGWDIVFFSLEHIEEIPDKIRRLLADDEYRCAVAENGYRLAKAHETWDNRADDFLKILDEIR